MIRTDIGRRRYRTRLKPLSGWPEVIALVDIFFLALIFFFLSGSFVRVSGISVELPRVRPSNIADMEKFVVTITPPASAGGECLLYFNDQPVTPELLKQRFGEVRGRSQTASVIIRADQRVSFETVAEVMAMAEAAKLSSFLAVMPPSERQETVFGQ